MKKIHLILCCVFMGIIVAAASAFSIYAVFDKNEISEKENRTLAKKPEFSLDNWFNSKLAPQIENYLNDHVFMRSKIIDKAADFEQLLKKEMTVSVSISNSQRKDIGSDVLVMKDRILALYIANKEYTKSFIKSSKEIFNAMPDNVEKYMMVSPSRVEFETEACKEYSDIQKDTIMEVYSKMSKDVKLLNSYSYLEYASQMYSLDELYYRTDHHWTPFGSSFAANVLLTTLKKTPVAPEAYEKSEPVDFYGYLFAMHEDMAVNIPPDNFYYYHIAEDIKEKVYGPDGTDASNVLEEYVVDESRAGYYTFIEGTYQYVVIDGTKKDGGSLMMINDSYGNALVPWIADQFDTVIMVDPRNFDGGKDKLLQLVEEYNVDTFMINVAVPAVGSSFAGKMEDLCN